MARLLALLWILALPLSAQDAPVERARVFRISARPAEPLFTFERSVTTSQGRTVAEVHFRDPAGQPAVSERVTYQDGLVVRHELVQHQVNERYVLTVSGDRAVIELERNGEISRSRHPWTEDTLTVDQIRPYAQKHWDQLMSGDEASFRLVALSRGRIVRFTLERQGSAEVDGYPAVIMRMRASSRFVRWFAPEIEMVFTSDGRTLLESRGPLPVKVQQGGRWVDLEARMEWESE